MKQSIRLTESDIKRIVRESVNRILREEWESPLEKAKKKRNDFDNVKKVDVSKFEKKSKKPKAGTFGDFPSFAKLKNRKDESRISKIVKESVNKIINEKIVMPSLDSNGDVIKCFTTRNAINGLKTSGSIFGKGIYLKVGEPPVEGNDYGQTFITVDVATNNLYFANDIRDAIEAAKSGNVPGIVFNSKHDGEVCVVFDDSIILGTSR